MELGDHGILFENHNNFICEICSEVKVNTIHLWTLTGKINITTWDICSL